VKLIEEHFKQKSYKEHISIVIKRGLI